MGFRDLVMAGCRLCLLGATALTLAAQGQYRAPRTLDGHPDFQGFWENNIATPLQRPQEIADRPTLTDAEVTKMRQKATELFTGKSDAVFFDGFYPAVLDNVLGLRQGFKSSDGQTGDYGSEWNDERTWENRTSLITDPPNGRIPPLTTKAIEARAEARKATQGTLSVKNRPLGERCITYGSPQLTAGYQSYYQIVETPGSVVIMTEMFHDARIVRMNGPHAPEDVKGWLGDSIGHWEGDTLVVDSVGFNDKTEINGFHHTESLHIVERFRRADYNTLDYEATIEDPNVFVKPWTVNRAFALRPDLTKVDEFVCEHNPDYSKYFEKK